MHLQNTLELLPDSDPVAFERLLELTDQGQFELIYPDDLKQGKIRLIYMMNDAAESFLAFEQARMKGKYKKDFEGEIEAELHLMKDQRVNHQAGGKCIYSFLQKSDSRNPAL